MDEQAKLQVSYKQTVGKSSISKQKIKMQNILFRLGNIMIIILLSLLIIASLYNILGKGLPGILESLATPEIQYSFKLSLMTSIISTIMCVIVAIPVAYGTERFKLPGKRVLNVVLAVPLALPPVVSGVALLLLFGQTEFGKMLASSGLKFVFTIKGIILAQFFVNIPYMIRVLKSTIADINPRLEFVGRTLGCSQLQAFFKITLPLAKNGLIAGIVITWARAIGEFGAALMLAGATRMKTETLPVSLYLNMSTGDLRLAMASATILIVISIVSLFVFEFLGGELK